MLAFIKIGFPELVLFCFFVLIPLLLIIFSIRDLIKAEFKSKNEKLIWILIILFAPVLGALLYLLIGKTRNIKTQR